MKAGANNWDPVPTAAQSVVSLPACTKAPYCRLKLENNIQKQKQNLFLICMVEIFHTQIQKAEQSPAQKTHVSPHSPWDLEKWGADQEAGDLGLREAGKGLALDTRRVQKCHKLQQCHREAGGHPQGGGCSTAAKWRKPPGPTAAPPPHCDSCYPSYSFINQ